MQNRLDLIGQVRLPYAPSALGCRSSQNAQLESQGSENTYMLAR
jgi:hypothetical protein